MDELFTERMLLKDILPEVAKNIAKEYELEEDNIEFIRKNNPLKPEDIEILDGERAAVRFINTADLDRDDEIVMPSGGQVNDFKKSPSVLYAHDYRGLPIGKDKWLKLISGKGWLAKTLYAEHQLAVDVYNLVKKKFLNTSSIGFIPLESLRPDSKGWDKVKAKLISEWGIKEKLIDKCRRIYTKWILLEHSDVPIPSNINALNIAVGKGFIKSDQLIKDLEIEIIDDKAEEGEAIELEAVEKPYPGEHACRIRSPGAFQPSSFRRMTRRSDGKEYVVIMGRLKGETTLTEQAYRYGIKVWTVNEARKHCKDHKGIEFTPATGKEGTEEDFDKELDDTVVKFHGSPRNPFGTHCSFRFKGGASGYKKAWILHCSQINGGALTPAASGPIRGTVRRIAMISAGMKPPCKVAEAEGMGARDGAKSPLPGTYPEKPSDYGLSSWLKPGDEGVDPKKALQFTCSDLNIIKRICVMEIKRRIKDREAEEEGKGISEEEMEFFEGLTDLESGQQILTEEEKLEEIGLFDIKELAEIVNRDKELIKENKGLKEKIEEIELKAGAVLNRKNKTDLIEAQKRIQNVLDSATTAEEEGKGADELEIEDNGLEIEEKEVEEKTNDGIDIDILKSALKDFLERYQEENKKQDIGLYSIINEKLPEIADIFYKKIKGKVI